MLVILTEVFRGFSQSLQENMWMWLYCRPKHGSKKFYADISFALMRFPRFLQITHVIFLKWVTTACLLIPANKKEDPEDAR
jgi:hypothetical protein